MNKPFQCVCVFDWVCMICTIQNHEDLTCGHLDPSGLASGLFSVFLKLKNEPCKILKSLEKYRVLGSEGFKMEPTWAPKVHLLSPKFFKKHCKIQGFSDQAASKKTIKHVLFVCKKVFSHNPCFGLSKTDVSEGQGMICSVCLTPCLSVFGGPD